MITFYNKEKGPGGASNLIINLVSYFITNNYEIKILSNKDSNIYHHFSHVIDQLCFIDMDEIALKKNANLVTSNDIIIITYLEPDILYFKKANPLVLFWNVFPTSLYNFNKFGNLNLKILTKQVIKKLLVQSGLVFMDDTGIDIIKKKLDLTISETLIIPIPTSTEPENKYLARQENNNLHVSFIGRAEVWKINSAIRVYKDLLKASLDNELSIVFHIITENPAKYTNYYPFNSTDKVTIIFHSNLTTIKKLKNFLIKIVDLNISMGTACIDGSSLGIPSLLVDASYSEINDTYKYKWIFQVKNYNLGRLMDSKETFIEGEYLTTIIKYFNRDRFQLSEKCYDYTLKNHSIESVSNKLLFYVNRTNFRLKDFQYQTIRFNRVYDLLRKFKRMYEK